VTFLHFEDAATKFVAASLKRKGPVHKYILQELLCSTEHNVAIVLLSTAAMKGAVTTTTASGIRYPIVFGQHFVSSGGVQRSTTQLGMKVAEQAKAVGLLRWSLAGTVMADSFGGLAH